MSVTDIDAAWSLQRSAVFLSATGKQGPETLETCVALASRALE